MLLDAAGKVVLGKIEEVSEAACVAKDAVELFLLQGVNSAPADTGTAFWFCRQTASWAESIPTAASVGVHSVVLLKFG